MAERKITTLYDDDKRGRCASDDCALRSACCVHRSRKGSSRPKLEARLDDLTIEVWCLFYRQEADLIDQAANSLIALSEDDRLEVFRRFCRSCGTVQPETGVQCQCWNNE